VYNTVLAVKVLKKLSIDYPDVHLTMIGPDKGDGSLQLVMQKAQSLGVYERLTIIPGLSHDAIAGWMNQADIFLNTTNYDVAPRSVLEAMANGLCIVSTNVGGMPWLVADRLEGLLVPPDDPEAMTAAVVRILEDPKLAACLNAAARRKAESLDWPAIIPIWNTNLRSLL
jgi:glycosyltransferase involved in cell wall biosynthesis